MTVKNIICCLLYRSGLLAFAAIAAPIGFAQFSGVPGCATAPCINPVPCYQCTGTWQDEYGGTWTVTSTSNSVTGTLQTNLRVLNPACINQTYTVTGTITPELGNASLNGAAAISLNATNPSPGSGGPCSVATYANLTGTIENDGCDLVGPSNANLSTNIVPSSSTTFTKPADIPSGETTTFNGWSSQYVTVGQWRGNLTSGLDLDGRQVNEGYAGAATDTCWFSGSSVPMASLSGGYWNVGFYVSGQWDDDYTGFSTGAVTYYRMNFRPPCSTNVPQGMYIARDGTSGLTTLYTTGSVGEGIPSYSTVSSSRDGQTMTEVWP